MRNGEVLARAYWLLAASLFTRRKRQHGVEIVVGRPVKGPEDRDPWWCPVRVGPPLGAFDATLEPFFARYGEMASGTMFLTDLALPLTSPSRTVTWMGGVNAKR